jgi:hypothetical protein
MSSFPSVQTRTQQSAQRLSFAAPQQPMIENITQITPAAMAAIPRKAGPKM